MEVRNCRSCGRLFNYIGGTYKNLCPACIEILEEKFQEVKKYVEDNPHCSINELSETMEVSVKQIEKWVREERLCFAEDSPIGLDCEKCGKMIKTGRFCDACRNEMQNQMSKLYKSEPVRRQDIPKKDTTNRMRFLDK